MSTALFAVLAVAALIAPLAAAQPTHAITDRRSADARPVDRMPYDRAWSASGFVIQLAGVGTGADNATYDVELAGQGLLKAHTNDANHTAFFGKAIVHATIADANGTVVKDADAFRIHVRAIETADGAWRWQLVSLAQTPFFGFPRLVLHGAGEGPDNGTLLVEGVGYALTTTDATDERLRLRLDVAGEIARASVHDTPDRYDVQLALTGVGVARDNATYDVVLAGAGKATVRHTDHNATVITAVFRLAGNATDANGTVIKQADGLLVRLRAIQHADGNGTWQLVSRADYGFYGLPSLALRGHTSPADGGVALDGKGHASFVPDDADRRIRMNLEVSGLLSRA